MADQKLIDLAPASALTGTELVYGVQAGNDVKITLSNLPVSTAQASAIGANTAKVKAQPVWCPIGFRGRGINGTAGSATLTPTGTAGVNTQTIHITPANIPIFAMRIGFANFDLTANGEADRPTAENFTNFAASLNVQMKNSTPPSFTFFGARTTTLAPAIAPLPHGFIMSDPLSYPIDAGNFFGIRATGGIAATVTYNGADYQGAVGGAAASRIISGPATVGGTSITGFTEFDSRLPTGYTDQTQTNANVSTSGQFYSLSPSIILGLMHPPAASLVTFGDSIPQGQLGGIPDDLGNVGYVNQSIRNIIPHVNLSRGSMQAAFFDTLPEAAGVLSLILASQMYVTDILMGLVRNDVNSSTVAQLKQYVAGACLPFQRQGIPTHVVTVPPYTASQDTWATLANQFYIYAQPNTNGSTASGSTTIVVTSVTGIAVGQLVATALGVNIAVGTTVTAIDGGTNTVTISQATTGTIATGTSMNFGTLTPNGYAAKAIQYNADLKAGYNQPSYNNNGFVFASVRDYASLISTQTGSDYKWNPNTTNDGIHPNQTGTTTVVNSGIVAPSTWGIWY